MSFILYLLAGFFSGMLGGMGMGGGTILIPALTILFGVEQHIAQATNLIAFLPMAAFSLRVHKDKGNLKTQGVWWIVVPAVLTSVAGGLAASLLPAAVLRKLFGAFLVFLALKGVLSLKFPAKKL
ncbi:MAG: sulfite exporter TauE/SafE family protein [Clostridia bacterium]|nr:sulfite exporter TauE/SafE family protein [Clostridia bacterium]